MYNSLKKWHTFCVARPAGQDITAKGPKNATATAIQSNEEHNCTGSNNAHVKPKYRQPNSIKPSGLFLSHIFICPGSGKHKQSHAMEPHTSNYK